MGEGEEWERERVRGRGRGERGRGERERGEGERKREREGEGECERWYRCSATGDWLRVTAESMNLPPARHTPPSFELRRRPPRCARRANGLRPARPS